MDEAPPGACESGRLTVRFVGDSGDGMQLIGNAFARAVGESGYQVSSLQEFPAEIRAPAGSVAGVSASQICFASGPVPPSGERADIIVLMNPAALLANLADIAYDATVVLDDDAFTASALDKLGGSGDPRRHASLAGTKMISVPMTVATVEAVKGLQLPHRTSARSRNFFALGTALALCQLTTEGTREWIGRRFGKTPELVEANVLALEAGYEIVGPEVVRPRRPLIRPSMLQSGTYRMVSGNEAVAMAGMAAATLTGRDLLYATYPITPASEILHFVAAHSTGRARAYQAEDEIAAICAAIGASYAGGLGMTGTSGPGLSLMGEALGLAVIAELPVVVVDVQRAGPSTGIPTKTEQSDLLQAVFGRHGDAPIPVIAPATPGECFDLTLEAWRIAIKFRTPVIVLSDGSIGIGSGSWRVPEVWELPNLLALVGASIEGNQGDRDPETLAPPWFPLGDKTRMRRTGGLERHEITGRVSYDPDNHQRMTVIRAEKVARVARDIPPLDVSGDQDGDLLILGWGSTFGAIAAATESLRRSGHRVGQAHLRYVTPFPVNTGDVLKRFRHVLVPEANMGQLAHLIRARYLVEAISVSEVRGRPLRVEDIMGGAQRLLAGPGPDPKQAVQLSAAPGGLNGNGH
jgi:2-oxoglutarate ferredoxin oxidoreductase subunit alpha